MKPGDKVIVYAGPGYGRVHIVESIVDDSRVVVRVPADCYVQNGCKMGLSVPVCDCEAVQKIES